MKIVVLSSGGVDSSVMMILLKKENFEILPLFVDYGQLAREAEWTACQKVCNYLNLKPDRIDVSGFGRSIPSGITNTDLDIEKNAFLPTRNMLLLTVGVAYGYTKSAHIIAIGLLANPIFPDQTEEFIQATQTAISKALGIDVKILAPLISLNKLDTLGLAHKYNLPIELTYYCHSGNKEPCGHCISCKEHLSAKRQLPD